MRYALLGIMGGFFLAFATPAVAPASYPRLSLATTTDLSYNWAGYVSQGGGTYSGVSGRWVVPEVAPGGTMAADAAWVGVGGVVSDDLIQAGTQAIVGRDGTVTYQAWIETMPKPSEPVRLVVSAGDEVAVSIETAGANEWQITIANNTTGQTYSRTVAYHSTMSSAEWIEEMPATLRGGFIPLDNFGSVRFLSASTTVNGAAQSISEAGGAALAMINRVGEPLAATSVLSQGGGFVVARSSALPTAVQRPRYAPHRGSGR